MWVLTIDQESSTRLGDRVPELLDALGGRLDDHPGLALPFERTVGDEVQGLLSSPDAAWLAIRETVRTGGWSIGVGVGGVDRPLGRSARASTGAAFLHAREAVERAKSATSAVALAVEGPDPDRARHAEVVLRLVGALLADRSPAGWEAVDALTSDDASSTQREAARRLGISPSALSQRLRAAHWSEEASATELVVNHLRASDPTATVDPDQDSPTDRSTR